MLVEDLEQRIAELYSDIVNRIIRYNSSDPNSERLGVLIGDVNFSLEQLFNKNGQNGLSSRAKLFNLIVERHNSNRWVELDPGPPVQDREVLTNSNNNLACYIWPGKGIYAPESYIKFQNSEPGKMIRDLSLEDRFIITSWAKKHLMPVVNSDFLVIEEYKKKVKKLLFSEYLIGPTMDKDLCFLDERISAATTRRDKIIFSNVRNYLIDLSLKSLIELNSYGSLFYPELEYFVDVFSHSKVDEKNKNLLKINFGMLYLLSSSTNGSQEIRELFHKSKTSSILSLNNLCGFMDALNNSIPEEKQSIINDLVNDLEYIMKLPEQLEKDFDLNLKVFSHGDQQPHHCGLNSFHDQNAKETIYKYGFIDFGKSEINFFGEDVRNMVCSQAFDLSYEERKEKYLMAFYNLFYDVNLIDDFSDELGFGFVEDVKRKFEKIPFHSRLVSSRLNDPLSVDSKQYSSRDVFLKIYSLMNPLKFSVKNKPGFINSFIKTQSMREILTYVNLISMFAKELSDVSTKANFISMIQNKYTNSLLGLDGFIEGGHKYYDSGIAFSYFVEKLSDTLVNLKSDEYLTVYERKLVGSIADKLNLII